MKRLHIDRMAKALNDAGIDHQVSARVLQEYWKDKAAVVWYPDDVREVAPDISDDDAIAVLQHAEENHDSEVGINWETLRASTSALFGEGAVR